MCGFGSFLALLIPFGPGSDPYGEHPIRIGLDLKLVGQPERSRHSYRKHTNLRRFPPGLWICCFRESRVASSSRGCAWGCCLRPARESQTSTERVIVHILFTASGVNVINFTCETVPVKVEMGKKTLWSGLLHLSPLSLSRFLSFAVDALSQSWNSFLRTR